MSDYQSTLNLPRTEFSMRANLSAREPVLLKRWADMNLYERISKSCAGRKKFILHDGPPYANGNIHIGHAVNKVLKDIILKSKRLAGFDCPYVPGWDCHGLPVELEVEKKYGRPGDKLSLQDFYARCREYATRQINSQREGFIRLGIFADWEKPYLTMAHNIEADTVRTLALMFKHGYIVRGSKPVYWCLDCRSALAEAEVEYQDQEALAVDALFSVCNPAQLSTILGISDLDDTPLGIPIWTTTPWTLPVNRAVALNKDFIYELLGCEIEGAPYNLLVAKDLREEVMQRYGARSIKIHTQCRGEKLEGLLLHHPFYERQVPVVLGHHVSATSGTGAVHIAPAHGVDDYLIGEKYHLPVNSEVDERGCYSKEVAQLAGTHINKAADKITDMLSAKQNLLARVPIRHSYPCCWRHKTGIIFRATEQWFVRMRHRDLLTKSYAEIQNTVNFEPSRARMRMLAMLDERPDWCISRQRSWGIPIAVFVHKQSGELHPQTDNLLAKVADAIEKHGIEYWHELDTDQLLGAEAKDYKKCTDIMDVWFDSGVTHRVVLDKHEALRRPADIYLEGSDQHRGWFQSSLLTSVAINGVAPYKQLISHGFVVDEQGHKMSKSHGNVLAPQKIIQQMGADILRLWVASTDYRDEMKMSDTVLERMVDIYRRIRNTTRFMLSNLYDFDEKAHMVAHKDMLALDVWIVHRAALLDKELRDCYEKYQFHLVVQQIHRFCSIDLGTFYLDIIKDRQYTMHNASLSRRSGQTAMFIISDAMVRWMAPILSFTAEEIWLNLPGKHEDSIFLARYAETLAPFYKEDARFSDRDWELLSQVRDAANQLTEQFRATHKLGSSLEAELTLYCDKPLLALLKRLGTELRFFMLSSRADIAPLEEGTHAHETALPGLKIHLEVSMQTKCERCWHRRPEVGQLSKPDLCARCVQNMNAEAKLSEERRFV